MSDQVKQIYRADNAPKLFAIKMELRIEESYSWFTHPIWISNNLEHSRPVHIDEFPFSPELRHLLYCFHDAWKASRMSQALSVADSAAFLRDNQPLLAPIEEALNLMAEQCENMLERWLLENEWESEVARASDAPRVPAQAKYNKLNAPRSIKIDMDYCSDPIWVSDETDPDNDTPCINDDIDMYPFPATIMHLLKTYQELWEASSCSQYLTSDCIGDAMQSDPETFILIDNSLSILHKRCEDLIERWLIENEWDTKLHRVS